MPQNYGKAWLTILIPALVVSLISIPLVFLEVSNFLPVVSWFLFFPLLILSVKLIYKTNTRISSAISLKLFLVILILVIVLAGIQTVLGILSNPINSKVPQSVCTADCKFAVRTDMGVSFDSLTVKGYSIPEGKYQEKENYIISQQTFTNLDSMERGVNNKLIGKLNANDCSYMEFVKDNGGTEGGSCEGSSSNFFTNLGKILIG